MVTASSVSRLRPIPERFRRLSGRRLPWTALAAAGLCAGAAVGPLQFLPRVHGQTNPPASTPALGSGAADNARGQSTSPSPACESADDIVAVDARAPWRLEGEGLTDLRPAPGEPGRLQATLTSPQRGRTLIKLPLASFRDLGRRWPVGLAGPFQVRVRWRGTRSTNDSDGGDTPRLGLYFKDAHWQLHETAPVAFELKTGRDDLRLELPPEAARDLTELGILLDWPHHEAAADGTLVVTLERLVLRVGPRRTTPYWPEGDRIRSLAPDARWHPDGTYQGIVALSGIERVNTPTSVGPTTVLDCNLDARDRLRWRGVAWLELGPAAPLDLAGRGVFVTLRAPTEFVSTLDRRCSVSVGLRDTNGGMFWDRGHAFTTAGAAVTAGVYPEMRFPPGSSFCSEHFDVRRVDAVGVAVHLQGRPPTTFKGQITLEDPRIVALPEELAVRRDRIAERIGRDNWMNTIAQRAAAADSSRSSVPLRRPVPIGRFLENVGVNYPWPKGVYAPVGRRSVGSLHGGFSSCAAQLRQDFEFLVRHHVRLVRIWLFGDARTGIIEQSDRRLALDPLVMPDLRALLSIAEEFPSLRLIPVLFDFHIANGVEREHLGVVGEHPDWLQDPARREELLDVLEPALELLAGHPGVAFIDLMNEPEHAIAVDTDDMRAFLTALAGRVHRCGMKGSDSRRPRCTIGSALTIYAPFWASTGIDLTTCHWFEMVSLSHPLGQHPAALDPAAAIMTEVDPTVGVDRALTAVWQSGFAGACFWSLNSDDGYPFREQADAFRRWVENHQR